MINASKISEFFKEGGQLSKKIEGYKPRQGQIEISREVLRAMQEGKHLFAEGPCGIGKSFAYLVPAIMMSVETGRKVVVATANIALQEQLVNKDLPFLAETLDFPFSYALMKGKNNYFCETRCKASKEDEPVQADLFKGDIEIEQHDSIMAWSRETITGDVSELDFKPQGSVWGKMCGSFEDCDSKTCEKKKCFSWQAKMKALRANVIVCNYHILFAHLAIKEKTGLDLILPEFDFVILDEGHEAEEIARDFFGLDIKQGALKRLARGCKDQSLKQGTAAAAKVFTDALKEVYEDKNYNLRFRGKIDDRIIMASEPVFAIIELLQSYWGKELRHSNKIGAHEDHIRRIENHQKRLRMFRDNLTAILSMEDENLVVWIEKGVWKKYTRYDLVAKPLNVSLLIRQRLFNEYSSVIVTSATLTASGSFSFIRSRLGVKGDPDVLEVKVNSPFNFRAQALLVVPDIGIDPRHEDFPSLVGRKIQEVVDHVGGKTLGLFTSYRGLNAAAGIVDGKGRKVFVQGEAPRTKLVESFKEDVDSILLGTTSFWTGVDVPGESLSCVVIDKLPFPNPSDPIVDAINDSDDRSFFNYSIPKACISFRQGFGRLIRSKECRGIVVCFDERIMTKNYGGRFLKSLPRCTKTRNLDQIPEFLAAQKVGPSLS